jgi:hypothetical protein
MLTLLETSGIGSKKNLDLISTREFFSLKCNRRIDWRNRTYQELTKTEMGGWSY